MTTKFLEKYRCPNLANIKVGDLLYLIKNGMCVADCLQKLTLNPSFRVTVIGLSCRLLWISIGLCRTYTQEQKHSQE